VPACPIAYSLGKRIAGRLLLCRWSFSQRTIPTFPGPSHHGGPFFMKGHYDASSPEPQDASVSERVLSRHPDYPAAYFGIPSIQNQLRQLHGSRK
jgi:hypothetical protein